MNSEKNIKIVKNGSTSLSFITPHKFIKYIINWKKHNVYEREKYLGLKLNKFDWYPTLLDYNDENQYLVFNYSGIPITTNNRPSDFVQQFDKILGDLKSENIQHNDIKHEEILVKDSKIYLCDFGWGSINNNMNCGIDIWGCKNTQKPGGYYDDSITLQRLKLLEPPIYKDERRKIGSQSETPSIKVKDKTIMVRGYQSFNIDIDTKNIQFIGKPTKFGFINKTLHTLKNDFNCKSIVDIGCNSGLTSLLAYNNKFDNIVSLDHDIEYINTLTNIKNLCNIENIKESLFSFGDKISNKFDVVFCGAIIHWIFSLTADFRNFDKITEYLLSMTNNYLIIEWICPTDPAIKSLNHINRRKKKDDENYCTENFEKSIKKYFTIFSNTQVDGSTRIIYILHI